MAQTRRARSADGTEIAYRVSGSGPALVLVHGAATSGADFVFARPHLEQRFTVAIMDRRGRGESGDGAKYALEREAEDVLAVLDAAEAHLLAGHSLGALCSILAAAGTDRLQRLVLYEPPIAVRAGDWLTALERSVESGEHDRALEGFLTHAGVPADQLEPIRSSPAWPVLLNAIPVLPRELRAAASWRHPTEPIDVPALFLIGGDTDSPVYLDGLDELAALFRDARRELIPGQRHIGHVFAAESFAQLVCDFCLDSG